MFYTLTIVLKILSIVLPLLISVAYFTLAERKIMASMQRRKGPNVIGTFGLLQPLADGFKLLIKDVLNDKKLKLKEQKQDEATTFKRRIPEQSEITIDDFQSLSANELSNKINSLQDPYPNAFIRCKDGSILFLTSSKHESNSD